MILADSSLCQTARTPIVDGLRRSNANNPLERLAKAAPLLEGTEDTASLLLHATEAIADALFDTMVEKGLVSGALARAAVVNAGLSAAGAWYAGLKLGIRKINEAHHKAHKFGIQAHMARGLSDTLALGTKNPYLPLAEVQQQAIARARKLYLAQAATDRLHRNGKVLEKDNTKRNERFEGLRRGIGLGLALLSPLSSQQRWQLGQLIRRDGNGIDKGFRQMARIAQPR